MKRKALKDKMIYHHIKMKPALKTAGEKLAKKEHTTLSQVMRIGLINYIEAMENIKLKV